MLGFCKELFVRFVVNVVHELESMSFSVQVRDFGCRKSELPKTAQAEALGRPDGLGTRWQG